MGNRLEHESRSCGHGSWESSGAARRREGNWRGKADSLGKLGKFPTLTAASFSRYSMAEMSASTPLWAKLVSS